MSYCVNCGVELDQGANECPLCRTPVLDPTHPTDRPDYPFFADNRVEVPPASRRALAVLLTAMLASATMCCGILNLLLRRDIQWWLYVAGAAAMLWIWFVLPLVKRAPTWGRLTMDVAAVALYLFLISLNTGGDWFLGFALPTVASAAAAVGLLSFLLRGNRRSPISALAMTIIAIGVLAVAVEFCADRYFFGAWQAGWSLVVATICLSLVIPLRIVRRVPSLRREAQRRFHL